MAGSEIKRSAFEEGGLTRGVQTEVASSRAAQEVQAAIVVAKRFPRSYIESERRIVECCKRIGLAEQSFYTYAKGGTQIHGANIRLAEVLAQNWGNLDFGVIELEQKQGESVVMSYCWDLETNVRQTKVFNVPHKLKTKQGDKVLTDPRDIYEHVANMGARRLRACILGIIPPDIQDAAVNQCQETIKGSSSEPLVDRAKKMLAAFAAKYGVTREMIEAKIQHNVDAISEYDIINLRGIWSSLQDGMSKREDHFDVAPDAEENLTTNPDDLKSGKKRTAAKKKVELASSKPVPPEPKEPALPMEEAEEGAFDAGDDPASTEEMMEIQQKANVLLAKAGVERSANNRFYIIGFACIGKDVPDQENMTKANAAAALAELKRMSPEDVAEALGL